MTPDRPGPAATDPGPARPRGVFDFPTGRVRPTMRGVLHAGALVVAVPAAVALVWRAEGARTIAAVYAVSLVLVLAISSGYHRLTRTQRSQLVMSRLDHGAIFLLIAGTYTPIVLIAVPSPISTILLSLVWGLALLAATGRVFRKLPRVSATMYVVVGWLALLALPWLIRYSPIVAVGLLVGGMCYTAGAILFALRRPVGWPRVFGYHEFFHLFTIGGFVTHFLCVAAVIGLASQAAA